MKHAAKPFVQPPVYTFQVESLSHEGRGIAHFGTAAEHPQVKTGKKVFIRYALPGETVRAKITHETKRLEEGELVELLSEPSSLRVPPICPHYGRCGGCSMQHMHPDEQIQLKQTVLKSHLQHFAGLDATEWLLPLRSTRQDYRHRARIGVRYLPAKKQLIMGFREHQSNRLTPITTCPILEMQLADALPELKQLLQSLKGKANIGHIELAKGDTDIALLVRHIEPLVGKDKGLLLDFVKQKGWQLYLQPKSFAGSLERIDPPQAEMRLHYSLPKFDLNFAFSPLDFTQVNPSVNQQMVQLACELLQLKQGEQVLDLFCGLGNFTLPLARCVGATGRVVGVEGSEEMVQRGTENARRNHISHVEFYSQDLTKDFSHHSWANLGFDALLIDPPRAGAYEVMQYIPNFGAKRIVYVSCNPATLARDASVLAEHGYQLKKAGVMDMFTHTGHVESIALFEKIKEIND
ncbi:MULTISPECIES: 23S rRNA (uracil(1939)-C(5))-methyltransferase RlmD [unclassified Acinetobacter]|uniref:23S rRNA (uracil(1939)-C(5))-methyltransferase RlmD n=1 Tax=unclassified Acinetobacter TaxID=196816 RepID=UPI00190AAB1B|nr:MULTISPECIES: 23S rRNA (uracil(1939)-C(5))-methyltransferase RlmD [unclassified Acinetobacter]MBK0062659.1 23S rRNA (uracil(1939)-C(5))-methyltransferase RlmD [Acinetobacter sp. S55]MBK0065764.1 23S rRNA (uracil(1939)-C(5))-methyltransferase RlmD [Acinetobacter sp. S54]